MQVPGISRAALIAMILFALALLGTGAAWVLSWVTHHTDTDKQVLPAEASIEISSDHGDVRVVGSDRADVLLTTKKRRSIFGTPHVSTRYADGRLRLHTSCSGTQLFGNECAVSYVVEVPRAMAVGVVASSADIHAEDVRGPLAVHLSSGDLDVIAPSPDIVATSSSGDIDVLATDATNVKAVATSGDVHVSVPDRTYAVHTRSDSGDRHLDVREDPHSPRHLDAETTSGDVHLDRAG